MRGSSTLARLAAGRDVAGGGRGAARRGRGRNFSRALPALLCCCGRRRRGARGPCGVRAPLFAACWGSRRGRPRRWRGPPGSRLQTLARPPRSPSLLWRLPARRPWPVRGPPPSLLRRAGGRGVVGRGGGAARRGRSRNPSRALLALLCGCGSPRRCARFLRRGTPPCQRRAGGRGRGRGVARWGCGLRFLRVWGPLPARGGGACCLGGGGGHLGWLRLPGWQRRPDQHRRLCQPPLLALREGLPRPLRGGGGAGAGPAVVAVVPHGGSHRSLPSRLSW